MIVGLDLIQAAVRQGSTIEETGHRPWPLPDAPWVMGQTWDDLLFAHWRTSADVLRSHVPDGLQVQEHDGTAWLGVTPFEITGLRPRGVLPLPFVSRFRELNVRTYVTDGEKPGVWFLTLDASSQLAVEAARRLYKLPYFRADITFGRRRGRFFYECVRDERTAFSGTYKPTGDVFQAGPDSLEYFLTERYCLYTVDRDVLHRAEIHHRPWPLQPAEATIDLNTMPPDDIVLEGELLAHYSARQDVLVWPLERVSERDT